MTFPDPHVIGRGRYDEGIPLKLDSEQHHLAVPQARIVSPLGWNGPLIRRARLPAEGELMQGRSHFDVLLLWSGGTSAVDVVCGGQLHRSRRVSGCLELLGAGTTVEHVIWKGERSSECIEVALPSSFGQVLRSGAVSLGVADPHLADLSRRLAQQAESGVPLGSLYVEALTQALAAYLKACYGPHVPRRSGLARGASLSERQCEELRAYIDEHLADNLTLSELAMLTGSSDRHFSRLFSRSFAMPPYQYLLECRIQRAKTLLQERRLSIAEVALSCGFASQAHLHTAFKARTGATPGAYRRQ